MSRSPSTTVALIAANALADLTDVRIDLEVTSVCDAVCGFCPRDAMPDKKRFIDIGLVERLAEDLRRTPVTAVILCGIGESTLHPQLEQIVSTLARAGARVEMTTHGGARMNVERFEALVAQGLASFNFSLNAVTAATHQRVMKLRDFDQTVANLRSILEVKRHRYPDVPVQVTFVVCNLNEHEVEAFVDAWRPKGVSNIWLHPVNNRSGLVSSDVTTSTHMDRLARVYQGDPLVWVDVFKDFGTDERLCKIAHKMIFISADGEMRLCAMDYQRTTSYGNLAGPALQDMHADKLTRYLSGEMNAFCANCDFCPTGIREAKVGAGG